MDHKELTDKIIQIVKHTAGFIREEAERFDRQADIGFKGRNDLVTYVDRQSEEELIRGLIGILPEAGVMAEEEHQEFQQDKKLNWIIDPLDGTLNFVHQLPCYCISVGLMEGNTVKAGVVYEINQDECFYAFEGGGAFLNGEKIHVSTTEALKDALFATGFPFTDPEVVRTYTAILNHLLAQSRGVRRIGSAAADLCYTAAGRFDGYYEFNLKPWDVVAGSLIVKEAGGEVIDFKGGNDYIFGGEIIAGNPSISKQFLDFFQITYKNL